MDEELIGGDILKRIESSSSALIVTHGGNIPDVIASIVGYFTKKDYSGVYLSLNKPHRTVESLLKRKGVSIDKLYYIDCITASIHSVDKDDKYVVYLDHPDDLSQKKKIMDAVDEFALSVPDNKFFVVDALRTILLYHEPDIVSEIIRDLIQDLKDINVKLVVLTRSDDDNDVIDTISHHFDIVL
ncbi:MAG: hypothetical protein ABH834_06065, partial [Candidatus Altiarchaeota archaeon]